MIILSWLELFQPPVTAGTAVTASAAWPFEYPAAQRADRTAAIEALAGRLGECEMPLAPVAMSRCDIGLRGEFGGSVASDAGAPVGSMANTITDWRVACAWLASLFGEASGAAESITAATFDAPTSLDWQGAVVVELAAYTDLRVEWSAAPREPVQVAQARLLASPGKRRLLAATGRRRLLKPV